ncbi:MAG: hypothetical protein SF029_17930 [bacterium]|nr:hypothetical protein [bacterium]
MTNLPVREMILYKHGVGFFVREGQTDSQEVDLTFRQDEINDVLKSLAVFDRAGGQVLGIHYRTPMDTEARLADSSIRLSDDKSLRDLLRDLRGRSASFSFETTPGTVETIDGRIIGLDDLTLYTSSAQPPKATLSLLTNDGTVRIFMLDALRSFSIYDSQSSHDLSYFLDTSMREDTRQTVQLRLSEGQHELVVYYVAPSPTWRVSYRLVAETDSGGSTGTALLQGWGLFDNRLEEDLENVKVTLVAGQPISFIYELYASRIPQRPTIEDESRVAPGPIEYEAAAYLDRAESAKLIAERRRGVPDEESSNNVAFRALPLMQMQQTASTPAAKGKDTGETFQYAVTNPVSVKRGESALVPIISAEIKYERELLYNGAKLPNHPVAALRFPNTTELTLERGPITVVENGDYKGEAVVPFTKNEVQVYLPYAVELGIKITERSVSRNETVQLQLKGALLVFENYDVQTVTYVFENSTSRAQAVLVEAPIKEYYDLFDTRSPDVETAKERRWRIDIPARGNIEFVTHERRLHYHHEEVLRLDHARLREYLRQRWLDQATFDRLSPFLESLAQIQRAKIRRTDIEAERKAVFAQQEQLRANIAALQPTGQEAAFRHRLLGQLEESQNRLDALDREAQQLTTQQAEAQTAVDDFIKSLAQNPG